MAVIGVWTYSRIQTLEKKPLLANETRKRSLIMTNSKKQNEVKCGAVNPTKRVSAFLLGATVLCLTTATPRRHRGLRL
jgi:hypothetical protein